MKLKPYQERALDALRTFLAAAAIKPHAQAYGDAVTVGQPGAYAASYRPLSGLPETPYCGCPPAAARPSWAPMP
jgi:type III restriction enzyme